MAGNSQPNCNERVMGSALQYTPTGEMAREWRVDALQVVACGCSSAAAGWLDDGGWAGCLAAAAAAASLPGDGQQVEQLLGGSLLGSLLGWSGLAVLWCLAAAAATAAAAAAALATAALAILSGQGGQAGQAGSRLAVLCGQACCGLGGGLAAALAVGRGAVGAAPLVQPRLLVCLPALPPGDGVGGLGKPLWQLVLQV